MSDRLTPETDAYCLRAIGFPTGYEWREFARKLERQRDEARDQLDRICRDGFGYQDTIGLEPCADYVLRKLNEERELARELRDTMKAITPYIGYPSTPTDVIYQFKNTLTKAKEVLP